MNKYPDRIALKWNFSFFREIIWQKGLSIDRLIKQPIDWVIGKFHFQRQVPKTKVIAEEPNDKGIEALKKVKWKLSVGLKRDFQ